MTELKTLKDFEMFNSDRKMIKQEAINDVKELKNLIEESSVHSLPLKFGNFLMNSSENYRELFGLIDYIKWKNNITEEDLK